MDIYKEHIIDIEIPNGFMNVAVTSNNYLIADTNNSYHWDRLRFPLPKGKWEVKNVSGKIVTLIHKAQKRTFWSKWF